MAESIVCRVVYIASIAPKAGRSFLMSLWRESNTKWSMCREMDVIAEANFCGKQAHLRVKQLFSPPPTSSQQHNRHGIETVGSTCQASLQWLPRTGTLRPTMLRSLHGHRSTPSRRNDSEDISRGRSRFSTHPANSRGQVIRSAGNHFK